jgi:hypothetical protein
LFLQSYFSNISPIWSIFWPIEKHDYNPIQRLSMICCRYHHGRLMVKILHLILLVNNLQNGNNSISMLWPHLFHNQPFIGVVNFKNSICYFCKCYSSIRHFCLI